MEPATIPPSSSSPSHTNISSTTYHTLSSIACTTNSHTLSHTTDHPHQTNTPTITCMTTLAPVIFPKQPYLKTTKPARTTSSISITNTSATTSTPAIFSMKSCSKRIKQSAQITIPKRHAPTFSSFISTDIRLKRHKNLSSHLHTTRLASQHIPPPVPLLLPPLPQNPHATPKYQPLLYSPPIPLPVHNTPTTITNTTIPAATINTTTIIT